MNEIYDIAVVGSGFAGSLMAMIAHRLGRKVLLLERGRHPRVVIGESSTPLSNLLLEELANRYGLAALKPLTKWGSWQQSFPDLACGLKRGFTFHYHVLGRASAADPERRDQLLVAASPNDKSGDTHWYRADFDHFLVREAQRLGVEYLDQVKLHRFINRGDHVSLEGTRETQGVNYRARFVIDATGPRGFLHRALSLKEAPFPDYPETQTLYCHFSGVRTLANGSFSRSILDNCEGPPYPIDDAAVHHVFEGGWVWVLQFNNGITSAGVVAEGATAAKLQLERGAAAWEEILELIPALREQFASARAEMPFTYQPRLPYRSSEMCGNRWAMLPSAAGFVDPLLSTGIPLTLIGIERLAKIIELHWGQATFDSSLRSYAACCNAELLATARLIAALYSSMNDFELFASLSLLYFTAVSYSEAMRRLSKPDPGPSFLLHDTDTFGTACNELFRRTRRRGQRDRPLQLLSDIRRVIEPINVAGLGNPALKNWYPAVAKDLMESAWKLGATEAQVKELLVRSGFDSLPTCALKVMRAASSFS